MTVDARFATTIRPIILLVDEMDRISLSVPALGGELCPTRKALREIAETYTRIDKNTALALLIVWLQGFANQFAFDADVKAGIRLKAAGFPVQGGLEAKSGFSKRQHEFLIQRLGETDSLVARFAEALCEADAKGGLFLAPKRVKLEVAIHRSWYQCRACTAISPVTWWRHCPNCLSPEVMSVEPASTSYLRARKSLWRDPVVRALEGIEKPLNLTVEEHTAQLSYRDSGEPNPTTEDFERCFRDILVRSGDRSIDVLSSTTTMEVGIDIGSLVAVGLRNIPPQRQNYQQRAGRAGRRGSAISTVLTYAQNNPHDNHYFEKPDQIIASDPPLPNVDTQNRKIVERHVRAQLIQDFFHSRASDSRNANIFTLLGKTWDFYDQPGEVSFQAFKKWIHTASEVEPSYQVIREWLPHSYDREPAAIAEEFLSSLREKQPKSPEELDQADQNLIEFFSAVDSFPLIHFHATSVHFKLKKSDRGRNTLVYESSKDRSKH